MQRGFNSRHHPRCHTIETVCFVNFADDFKKHPVRIVPLAKEAPVESVQPLLSPEGSKKSQTTDPNIRPAARSQDAREWFLTIDRQVCDEYSRQRRHDSDHHSASKGVLQPLTDDDVDIQDPMSETGIC